jgi:glyoxylase-like metal-dependent hydrolase (beta-lactamase superfamily II)
VETHWRELRDGVLIRRLETAAVNAGLVLGDERALVVDTGATAAIGAGLLQEVREVTALPLVVVNTHAHFDHCFGNAAFAPAPIWAHEQCAAMQRHYWTVQARMMAARAEPPLAAQLGETAQCLADHSWADGAVLDLGGRSIELRHPGRGHTNGDTVVVVPDAGVLFAGDFVEESDSPGFSDSFPLDWPGGVDLLLEWAELLEGPGQAPVVVPGHGDPMTTETVAEQGRLLARVAQLAREAYAAGDDAATLAARLPLPEWAAPDAAARALRQLAGGSDYDPPEEILATL